MKTTVSFHGPQGSGKTVLSRAFREFLSARGVPVTLLDPEDRRNAADNFSVEVETNDLLVHLEALQAQPVGEKLVEKLTNIAIAECDRAVRQALRGERNADGALYDTCFGKLFAAALAASPPVVVSPKWDVCRNCVDGSKAGQTCTVCEGRGHVPFVPTPVSPPVGETSDE